MIEIRKSYRCYFPEKTIEQFHQITGEPYRQLPDRYTLQFNRQNKSFFIKYHTGVGWCEIIKNILKLRLPVLGAKREWLAILWLQKLGVKTMTPVGFGQQGLNPATQHSFIITEDLGDCISLETLTQQALSIELKRYYIRSLAQILQRLHTNGLNHRDCYLCHFLVRKHELQKQLYVIDLHRMQKRANTPERWIIKDLAGLYFSSMHITLTQRDILRFIKVYRNKSLRAILAKEHGFWAKVEKKAKKLYAKESIYHSKGREVE